jgi:pimeloyl-ACP methyl ester carboxylesterase
LAFRNAEVVGHDIGLMVAYAYAAQFPAEVKKLVLMDAFLPGVEGWEPIYNNPGIWHFRFNEATPEALAKDFAVFARTKLPMPILSIGGDKGNGDALGRQAKLIGSDVTVVVLKDTGHWLMEERPPETTAALVKFL